MSILNVSRLSATGCQWLQAWNLTGDAFTHHPGDKPWISEMYGYSFGTAAANVWHKVNYEAMLYPGYTTYGAIAQLLFPASLILFQISKEGLTGCCLSPVNTPEVL